MCGLKHKRAKKASMRVKSHPTWVCGLKLWMVLETILSELSHPTWVCGLKHSYAENVCRFDRHTLRGCVD